MGWIGVVLLVLGGEALSVYMNGYNCGHISLLSIRRNVMFCFIISFKSSSLLSFNTARLFIF